MKSKRKPRSKNKKENRECVIDYKERAVSLRVMGFSSYSSYLDSPLWRKIRGQALARDHYRCRLCNRRANQAHHRSYDLGTMRGEKMHLVVSICRGCHKHVEFAGTKKRTPEMVTVGRER